MKKVPKFYAAAKKLRDAVRAWSSVEIVEGYHHDNMVAALDNFDKVVGEVHPFDRVWRRKPVKKVKP